MSTVRRGFNFDLDPRSAGPATKWLTGTMLITGVLFSITQRTVGFGTLNLHFDVGLILSGELWRLASYPFVAESGFGLILGAFIFYLFSKQFEAQWGTPDFVRFAGFATVGAALLAVPFSLLLNVTGLFRDVGASAGPNTIIYALLMALAINAPNANVLYGFVIPMRAKTMISLIIGVGVLIALVDGATRLSMTLGGLAMGYLLVTGTWRPSRWFALAKKKPQRRRGLYVVPPKDQTLH